MKLSLLRATFLFACVFIGGCAKDQFDAPQKSVRAAVAEIDITPPVGHRMAGYFDERFATGTHDPLRAKAIVLTQGREQFALVFCDLLGMSLHVSEAARRDASRKSGIPVSHILISATHTHTGPLFDDVRRDFLHKDAIETLGSDPHETIYYPDFLKQKLVQVILDAQSRVQPAQLEIGIAKQEGISFNRRYVMSDGKVAFNPGQLNPKIVRPAGPIDPDVGMLLVRDADGKRIGGLTVFAMHADTTGGTLYSADYPFFLQQTLREKFGENYLSAFAAGTCGDINHINVAVKEPTSGFAVSERLGSTLGKTVLENLSDAKPVSHPRLAMLSKKIDASLQEVTPAQIASAKENIARIRDSKISFATKVEAVKTLDLAEKGPQWPLEIQVLRLDDNSAVVGLPCEIFVHLGLAIKAASPSKNTIVMSICNDRPSYVPTRKAFEEGSYEINNARVKPGVGEMLVETAVELLQQARK